MKWPWKKKKVEIKKVYSYEEDVADKIASIEAAGGCVHDSESIEDEVDKELLDRFQAISSKNIWAGDWNPLLNSCRDIAGEDCTPATMTIYRESSGKAEILPLVSTDEMYKMRDRVCLKCGKIVRNAKRVMEEQIRIYERLLKDQEIIKASEGHERWLRERRKRAQSLVRRNEYIRLFK